MAFNSAVLVLCFLSPFAGAITISYSADSGGESVSLSENYDVDNTVTVKESTYTAATANTLYSKRITLRDRMQMILLKFWMARYQQSLLQK